MEREGLAHVAQCEQVIEYQQDIARARKPEGSDDPLPTERGEGGANVLGIHKRRPDDGADKGPHRINKGPGQFPGTTRSGARGRPGSTAATTAQAFHWCDPP